MFPVTARESGGTNNFGRPTDQTCEKGADVGIAVNTDNRCRKREKMCSTWTVRAQKFVEYYMFLWGRLFSSVVTSIPRPIPDLDLSRTPSGLLGFNGALTRVATASSGGYGWGPFG